MRAGSKRCLSAVRFAGSPPHPRYWPGVRLRRIGAIGDIHCEDRALELTLDFLGKQDVDLILAVGDIVDGYGDCDRCCEMLRETGVEAVRGNHDRWFLSGTSLHLRHATESLAETNRAWLSSLPATRRFETIAGDLLLCHGVGNDDMIRLLPHSSTDDLAFALDPLCSDRSLAFMIGGHTHHRMVRPIDGLIVINAGTLHRDYFPGFITVDFTTRIVEGFDLVYGQALSAEKLPFDAPSSP